MSKSIKSFDDVNLQDMGTQIVVVDYGFVYVGEVTIRDGYVLITNCRNIRVWGTTKGLGQLRAGPQPKTVLDEVGCVLIPHGRINHFIPCTLNW